MVVNEAIKLMRIYFEDEKYEVFLKLKIELVLCFELLLSALAGI